MKLTDAAIKNAKPAAKTRRLFDGRGLYLEISPKGGKWWRLKYQFDGREKRISMGVYPDVPLKDARERRDEARRLIAKGIDPSEQRKAIKAAERNTFEAVTLEWIERNSRDWTPRHTMRVRSRMARDILPWLGSHPVHSITAPQLLDVIRRIERRGVNYSARRALSDCGRVFRFAIATGRATHDPSAALQAEIGGARGKHFAAVTDPERVGDLLRAIHGYRGTLVVECAMRLAPLVFVRPGELRRAEWEHIDLERADWRYRVTKTDTEHVVPLSRQAVAILEDVHPLTGHGRYVFPSARTPAGNRPMSDNAVLAAMRRMGIDKDEMTGHGWRATARTLLDEMLGFRPDWIEHQLAHSVRDPNGRAYNRTAHLEGRAEMMQAWADYLDGLRRG
ncbi:MAG: integrase arm-type DNA-binding domain-containing protein [Pseudomonadota bacterium]|nr:integrase arm-type DNA-binding domain-containing protein [Pseudomonadota bacterium]